MPLRACIFKLFLFIKVVFNFPHVFFLPAKHRFCITLHKKLKNLNCIKHLQDPIDLHVFRQHQICNMNIAAVAQWFAPWAGGRGFDPRPCHTKDIKNGTRCFLAWRSAYKDRSGSSLLSNLVKKKRWIPSGMSSREW